MKARRIMLTLEIETDEHLAVLQSLSGTKQVFIRKSGSNLFYVDVIQAQANTIQQARAEKLANRRRAAVRHA